MILGANAEPTEYQGPAQGIGTVVEGLATLIAGEEKAFTATQKHAAVLVRNRVLARVNAGSAPAFTAADFTLLYHAFR